MNQLVKAASFFVFFASVGVSQPAFAAPGDEAAHTPNRLTAEQKEEVLTALNDICGDTWCEGEFNYSFNKMDCNLAKGKCTIKIELISTDDNEVETRHPRTVVVKNIHAYSDMIEITHNRDGRRLVRLNDMFYEEVGNLFGRAEQSVRDQLAATRG